MRKLVLLLFYVVSLLIPNYVKPNEPPVLNEYTIYFEENGGTEIADITAQETTEITPEITTKEGYDFAGWYLTEDCTGEEVELTIMPSGNVTLYAKWTPTEYVITYHLDLGTNHPENPDIYTIEDNTIILKNPTKESYVFNGWYTNEECTSEISQIECANTLSDINLYAKFSPEQYYITFKSYNGAETLLEESLISYGETLPTVSQQGYIFAGWARQINNTSSTLYTTTPDLGENLTEIALYANWSELGYSVKIVDYVSETDFVGTAFSGTMPSTWTLGTEFNYTTSMNTINIPNPESDGRIFDCYKVYVSGTWTTIYQLKPSDIENGLLKEDSTLLIYAVWGEASFCTITLDANGGTFTNSNTTMIVGVNEYDNGISISETPTNGNFNFAGWCDSNGTIIIDINGLFISDANLDYLLGDCWYFAGEVTLYAVWE